MNSPFAIANTSARSISFDPTGTGFTGTNVQDVILEAINIVPTTYVTATSTITTSSGTFAVMGSMTATPAAGTYLVMLSVNADTTLVNGQGEFAIFSNGSIVQESSRDLQCNSVLLGVITISTNAIGGSINCMAKITVNGSQAIDGRYRSNNGITISVEERVLTLMRIAP